MSDPYGAPQDDPHWSPPPSAEDRPVLPPQPALPPWTPPSGPPPASINPPTAPYPAYPPTAYPWQPGPATPAQPGYPATPAQPGYYAPPPPNQPFGGSYPAPAGYPPSGPYWSPGGAYPPAPGYPGGPWRPENQPNPFAELNAWRRRRTLTRILVGVGIILVIGGVVAALSLVKPTNTVNTSAAAGGTASASTATGNSARPASAAPTGGVRYTLTAPDRIGGLRKAADQSGVDSIGKAMAGDGISQSIAVAYEDTAAGNKPVLVWGAGGGVFGVLTPKARLDAFFTGAGKSAAGGTVGTRTPVDPGTAGGSAECADITGTQTALALCAWAGGDVILGVMFVGESAAQGGGQMRTIVPAVVQQG
jgi:hypothetical protein